jgi:hypothetical protein
MSQDSSAIKATGYGLDDRGSITDMGRDSFLSHRVQNGRGAHSVSYRLGTGDEAAKK